MEKVRETQTKGKKENAGRPCELVNSCRIQAERGELVPKELQGTLDISFLYTFEVALLPDQEGNVLTTKGGRKGKVEEPVSGARGAKRGGAPSVERDPGSSSQPAPVQPGFWFLVFGFWFF